MAPTVAQTQERLAILSNPFWYKYWGFLWDWEDSNIYSRVSLEYWLQTGLNWRRLDLCRALMWWIVEHSIHHYPQHECLTQVQPQFKPLPLHSSAGKNTYGQTAVCLSSPPPSLEFGTEKVNRQNSISWEVWDSHLYWKQCFFIPALHTKESPCVGVGPGAKVLMCGLNNNDWMATACVKAKMYTYRSII